MLGLALAGQASFPGTIGSKADFTLFPDTRSFRVYLLLRPGFSEESQWRSVISILLKRRVRTRLENP